jgi:hypothetical protein
MVCFAAHDTDAHPARQSRGVSVSAQKPGFFKKPGFSTLQSETLPNKVLVAGILPFFLDFDPIALANHVARLQAGIYLVTVTRWARVVFHIFIDSSPLVLPGPMTVLVELELPKDRPCELCRGIRGFHGMVQSWVTTHCQVHRQFGGGTWRSITLGAPPECFFKGVFFQNLPPDEKTLRSHN